MTEASARWAAAFSDGEPAIRALASNAEKITDAAFLNAGLALACARGHANAVDIIILTVSERRGPEAWLARSLYIGDSILACSAKDAEVLLSRFCALALDAPSCALRAIILRGSEEQLADTLHVARMMDDTTLRWTHAKMFAATLACQKGRYSMLGVLAAYDAWPTADDMSLRFAYNADTKHVCVRAEQERLLQALWRLAAANKQRQLSVLSASCHGAQTELGLKFLATLPIPADPREAHETYSHLFMDACAGGDPRLARTLWHALRRMNFYMYNKKDLMDLGLGAAAHTCSQSSPFSRIGQDTDAQWACRIRLMHALFRRRGTLSVARMYLLCNGPVKSSTCNDDTYLTMTRRAANVLALVLLRSNWDRAAAGYVCAALAKLLAARSVTTLARCAFGLGFCLATRLRSL